MNTSVESCDELLTIPQFSGTCWFNALLMITFFSDMMRKFIIKNMDDVCHLHYDKPKFLELLVDLLSNDYVSNPRNNNYFYNKLKPEYILLHLHNLDSKNFAFDPRIFEGFNPKLYFPKLMSYLNMNNSILYLNDVKIDDHLYYSPEDTNTANTRKYYTFDSMNWGFDFKKKKKNAVENNNKLLYDTYNIQWKNYLSKKSALSKFEKLNDNFGNGNYAGITNTPSLSIPDDTDVIFYVCFDDSDTLLQKKIVFKNATFVLDAISLMNYKEINHEVCGITCKNSKYIYNGWTRKRIREKRDWNEKINIPIVKQLANVAGHIFAEEKEKSCQLYEHDWTNDKNDFCIEHFKCRLKKNCSSIVYDNKNEFLYNPNKSYRSYYYVRDTLKKMDDTVVDDPNYLSSLMKSVDKKKKKKKTKPVSEKKKKTIVYEFSPKLQSMHNKSVCPYTSSS
jgi:hypothetical protein